MNIHRSRAPIPINIKGLRGKRKKNIWEVGFKFLKEISNQNLNRYVLRVVLVNYNP